MDKQSDSPDTPANARDPLSGEGDAGHCSEPDLEARIVEALKTVYDPEIPVDIYQLGLIYNLDIDAHASVRCTMTLTSPGCPVAGTLPGEVEAKIAGVAGVAEASVEVVWDPVWNPSMMSEAAKLELGMF